MKKEKSAHPEATKADGDPAARARSSRRLVEDHQDLRSLLERVEATSDLKFLLPALMQLRTFLVRHFAGEEGPNGFRSVVWARDPNQMHRVDKFFSEHKGFLTTLGLLVERVEEVLAGPVAEIQEEVGMFTERLREHEAQESELLSEVMYRDTGESGG